MPRTAATSIHNNFTRGLVTESTALNFPEDGCTETYNCVFDEKARVYRRLGIDFESSYGTQTANRAGTVVASYYWKAAAGNGDNALSILQVGSTLYFYLVDTGALSDNVIDTLDLTTFSPAGAPSPEENECEFAAGNGYLFVSHPELETFYVEYDEDAETISATQIDIYSRDFIGVDDSLDIDERPSSLSSEHNYNLLNQGWYVSFPYSGADTAPRQSVITSWNSQRATDYPANSDIWWLHLRASSDGDPPEFVDFDEVGHERGNSPAAKGHFLLKAFYQDRSDVSGVSGLDVVSSGYYRPSTLAFHAGRVWYGGVTGQKFSNRIYFSQIVEDTEQFGRCYQQNDPTDRDNYDLLPSDGGVIQIQEAGSIIKLFPLDNNILVFASNGIWSITGSEGIGFRANDYTVRKVSSTGALTASSFVDISGYPAWWNEEGIYLASVDQVGSIQEQSLTDKTIKEFGHESVVYHYEKKTKNHI